MSKILNIIQFPDQFLKKLSPETSVPLSNEDRQFCLDMINTMNHSNGIGLAACQVGKLESIVVMKTGIYGDIVLINPKYLQISKSLVDSEESCLSIPNTTVKMKRNEWVVISAFDLDGNLQTYYFTGIESFCMQHEMDHLEGKLITDGQDIE